jgi:hypothetical protein
MIYLTDHVLSLILELCVMNMSLDNCIMRFISRLRKYASHHHFFLLNIIDGRHF